MPAPGKAMRRIRFDRSVSNTLESWQHHGHAPTDESKIHFLLSESLNVRSRCQRTDQPTGWPTDRPIHRLTGRPTYWLVDWLTDWRPPTWLAQIWCTVLSYNWNVCLNQSQSEIQSQLYRLPSNLDWIWIIIVVLRNPEYILEVVEANSDERWFAKRDTQCPQEMVKRYEADTLMMCAMLCATTDCQCIELDPSLKSCTIFSGESVVYFLPEWLPKQNLSDTDLNKRADWILRAETEFHHSKSFFHEDLWAINYYYSNTNWFHGRNHEGALWV